MEEGYETRVGEKGGEKGKEKRNERHGIRAPEHQCLQMESHVFRDFDQQPLSQKMQQGLSVCLVK